MQIERLVAGGVDRGDDDREIFGTAACHHGVDRDLLDSRAAVVGRNQRDQLVAGAPRGRDRPVDAGARRRDDRQAVGHATGVELLDRIGIHVWDGHRPEANTAVGSWIGPGVGGVWRPRGTRSLLRGGWAPSGRAAPSCSLGGNESPDPAHTRSDPLPVADSE